MKIDSKVFANNGKPWATFVLAVGLLAGAVLVYARMRDLILPLMVITPVLVGFAGARVLLWPDSLPLRVALEVSYRFLLLTAAVALLRARRGRLLGGRTL